MIRHHHHDKQYQHYYINSFNSVIIIDVGYIYRVHVHVSIQLY